MSGGDATAAAVAAIERAVHFLDRAHEGGFKTKAFLRARTVVQEIPSDELDRRVANGTLAALDGIGSSTERLVTEAVRGETAYLDKLDRDTRIAITEAGAAFRKALRGDCHLHSRWSDGGAPIEAMAEAARSIGHEYVVLTDHSPRLTVAHGLNRERLEEQLAVVDALNAGYAEHGVDFRVLTGIEVDILEDGTLDHGGDVLERLDVVVASVHSKLKMERSLLTERMLSAICSPHVDILGHCTGRMIGRRDPSQFDVEAVFDACAAHGVAVEINCRPERLDPPRSMLRRAVEAGCLFAIDSDAHSTGQLEWQPFGCDRAAECDVPIDRVVNTWTAQELLRWTRTRSPKSG